MKRFFSKKRNYKFDCRIKLYNNSNDIDHFKTCNETKIVCRYPQGIVRWVSCGVQEEQRGMKVYNFFDTYSHLMKFCMAAFINIELKKKHFNELNIKVRNPITHEIYSPNVDEIIDDEIDFRIELNNLEYDFWLSTPNDELYLYNKDKDWIFKNLYKRKKDKVINWK
jgi:hypothetical protein